MHGGQFLGRAVGVEVKRLQGVQRPGRLGLAQGLHGLADLLVGVLAGLVDAVNRKHVLGEVDTHGQNRHVLPLPNALMGNRTSHRGTWLPLAATRLVRDGEVPFIR